MRTVTLSILLAAAAALASAANAQTTPIGPDASNYAPVGGTEYSPPTDSQPSFWDDSRSSGLDRIGNAIDAMKSNNFAAAESIFADYLLGYPTSAEANLYMGVTKMNLGKWDQAKKYLEIAASRKPKHPDPKSRLGVTYAKLGDTARANALRADLVKMNDACKDACRLSPYIKGGIQMIDEALAKPEAPKTRSLG